MKKVLLFTALAAALTAGFAQASEKLVVAATPIPHAEILELIKPTLAKEGVDLQIKVFTDYVQPNVQVAEKRLDANYFQTLPYLENFNKGKGTNLVTVVGVHVEPFGGYSKKIKKIEDLKDGATVAIPNEGSNSGRALLLLQKAGVITLKDPTNALATPKDIASNPKNLKFKELESALLPRVLDQVDQKAQLTDSSGYFIGPVTVEAEGDTGEWDVVFRFGEDTFKLRQSDAVALDMDAQTAIYDGPTPYEEDIDAAMKARIEEDRWSQ